MRGCMPTSGGKRAGRSRALNARQFAGKTLEFIGLVTVGTAFFYGTVGDDMGKEFQFLGIGVTIFFVGWLLEGRRARG